MYTKWTQTIRDPADKDRFEKQIYSAKPVLNRLIDILREDERALNHSETDLKTFESPNWHYRQAFKNGQRNKLEDVLKLIDLDQQEKHNE